MSEGPAAPRSGPAPEGPPAPATGAASLLAIMRTPGYARVLLMAGAIGIPISALGYGFVLLYSHMQGWLFTSWPSAMGLRPTPTWWPLPLMVVAGLIVGLALRYLPGHGGHSPAEGFSPGTPAPITLPGIMIASIATLGFGLVLGPEAPLIALGGGTAIFISRQVQRHAQDVSHQIVGASGSLSSLGTIFGSPLTAAIFLMEGIGLGGEQLTLLIVPGLLAAGIGALVFVGLGAWTGVGTISLGLPSLPPFTRPDLPELGWCIVLGVGLAALAWVIRLLALLFRRPVERRVVWATPLVGLAVAGLVMAFTAATGRTENAVLFSGQDFLAPLVATAGSWTVGALLLLVAFKSLAYALSLSSFRGGPVFPSLLIGAAVGVAASHLPGFGLVPGLAAGMGAMTAAMLRLPVASVLLPVLLLAHDAIPVSPLVIVAVVVSFITVQYLPDPQQVAGAIGPHLRRPAPQSAGGGEAPATGDEGQSG